jgi:membrane-associated protease RseP (regulator of RpoE activity)
MTKLSLLGCCTFLLLLLLVGVVQAFTASQLFHPSTTTRSSASRVPASSSSTCLQAALTLEQIQLRIDCYDVSVQKPLGVIFGENPEPYLGLVVDDISEGMNGGKAGLRKGDQLVGVNGKVVLGFDFDSSMSKMTDDVVGPVLDLTLYRGPVRQLYTILGNQLEEGQTITSDYDDDDEDNDDDDSEVIIMDENYESPVQIDMSKYEDKPLTAGDFVKAIGKLGSMLAETATSGATDNEPTSEDDLNETRAKKKKTGFFGFGGESIQLEGDDAKGYK